MKCAAVLVEADKHEATEASKFADAGLGNVLISGFNYEYVSFSLLFPLPFPMRSISDENSIGSFGRQRPVYFLILVIWSYIPLLFVVINKHEM